MLSIEYEEVLTTELLGELGDITRIDIINN